MIDCKGPFCEDCGDCVRCFEEDDCGGIPGKKHNPPRDNPPRDKP